MNITAENFQEEVLDASLDRLVLVAWGAPDHPPSRLAADLLDQLAAESAGEMVVVRVDASRNPQLVKRYKLRGAPTVQVFQNGQVIDQFVGFLPEPAVRDFLARLKPSVAEIFRKDAHELLHGGRPEAALSRLMAGLLVEPGHEGLRLEAAALHLDLGHVAEARQLLEKRPEVVDDVATVQRLKARIALQDDAAAASLAERAAAAAQHPDDGAARLAYGRALLQAGDVDAAFEQLLATVRLDGGVREDARLAMLGLLDTLGDDPRAADFRRRLASALF